MKREERSRGLETTLRAHQTSNSATGRAAQRDIGNVAFPLFKQLSSNGGWSKEDVKSATATRAVSGAVSEQTKEPFFDRIGDSHWACGGFTPFEQMVDDFVGIEATWLIITVTRAEASVRVNTKGG